MSRRHVLAWQAQSVLLGYPDSELVGRQPLLRRVANTLDERVGAPLLRFLDHLAHTPPTELAADYVATFDNRKRCCPYLTYYAHGDTRKRGMALLHLKQAYTKAGLKLTDDELPDHLAVMLEFAATNPDTGRPLLLQHRAGLELLRQGLHQTRSPWADILDSVSATLPPLRGNEQEAVTRLIAQGPPAEQVGLAPFAPFTEPEYLPRAEGAHR
jgi:nitrate reductase molybdenum cofactor assembly chaperone NarJ/NarW